MDFISSRVTTLEARMEMMEEWQKRQNSCIQRVDRSLDVIYKTVILTLSSVILSIVLLLCNILFKVI